MSPRCIILVAGALCLLLSGLAVLLVLGSASAAPDLDFAVPDPAGDTIGSGPVQHDIISVTGASDGTDFTLTVEFAGPVSPPDSGLPTALTGFIAFDTDQDPATGIFIDEEIAMFCPEPLGIGDDANLSLFFYEAGSAPLLDPDSNTIADIPLEFSGTSVTVIIPLDALSGDELFNFSAVLGAFVDTGKGPDPEPTDCAPGDGGFIDTAGFQVTPEPTATATPTVVGIPPTTVPAATPTATAAASALPDTGAGTGGGRGALLWAGIAFAGAVLLAGGWLLARSRYTAV